MIKLIITDTHFGVKNNSTKFLDNQLRVFEDLRDMVDNSPDPRIDLIHLGDLFDSRSTVSIYVFDRVKKVFIDLYNRLKKRDSQNTIIFLAGNHDFYSQNSSEVNTLSSLMSSVLPDCKYITQGCKIIHRCLYIPWYTVEDIELMKEVCEENKDKYDTIFTHTDLYKVVSDLAFLQHLGKIVISGHIHKSAKYIYDNSKLYNISPPYAINFGDAGDESKGVWKLEDGDLTLFKNSRSLMFWNLKNDEIFNISEKNIKRGDNYNIYINKINLSNEVYVDKIKELSTKIQFLNIIPVSDEMITEITKTDIDIDDIIYNMIGEERKEYFDQVKKAVEEYENQ